MNTFDVNRRAWDRLAAGGSQFSAVASDAECAQPLIALDGRGWLPGSVKGLEVLCLASGGGWQAILYAVAGANVTVVDLSPQMLKLDAREAERRGVSVKIVEASMDELPLEDESFDIVHQPVSTCYVPRVRDVYAEVARVLRGDGLYISQHKQPTSLQIAERDARDRYVIGVEYYHIDPLPEVPDRSYREAGCAGVPAPLGGSGRRAVSVGIRDRGSDRASTGRSRRRSRGTFDIAGGLSRPTCGSRPAA